VVATPARTPAPGAVFQGISLLAKDDVRTRVGDYVYKINLTGPTSPGQAASA